MKKYSNNIFHIAFKDILEEKGVKLRGLASRTNLNYTYFSKLKNREKSPPIKTIEIIARGLRIDPEYFLEYRMYKVTDFLMKNPDYLEAVISYIDNLREKRALRVAESGRPFKDQ